MIVKLKQDTKYTHSVAPAEKGGLPATRPAAASIAPHIHPFIAGGVGVGVRGARQCLKVGRGREKGRRGRTLWTFHLFTKDSSLLAAPVVGPTHIRVFSPLVTACTRSSHHSNINTDISESALSLEVITERLARETSEGRHWCKGNNSCQYLHGSCAVNYTLKYFVFVNVPL